MSNTINGHQFVAQDFSPANAAETTSPIDRATTTSQFVSCDELGENCISWDMRWVAPALFGLAASVRKRGKEVTVENKKVFLELIDTYKQPPPFVHSPNCRVVEFGEKGKYQEAVKAADEAASAYLKDRDLLSAGKATLLGAYYSKQDIQAPQSEALARFLDAGRLFREVMIVNMSEKANEPIRTLAHTADQNVDKTMFVDLLPLLEDAVDPDRESAITRFHFMKPTLDELFRTTPPQDRGREYKRFKEEGGVEAALDKIDASTGGYGSTGKDTNVTKAFSPSYLGEWNRIKTANDEAARFNDGGNVDFVELEDTAKLLRGAGEWEMAAAFYLKASSAEGATTDYNMAHALVDAGASLINAGRFTEAERHFKRVLKMFDGKQDSEIPINETSVLDAEAGIDRIIVITGRGLKEEAVRIESWNDPQTLSWMAFCREDSIDYVYVRAGKTPPFEVVASLSQMYLRQGELVEKMGGPENSVEVLYKLAFDCYERYGYDKLAISGKAKPNKPGMLRDGSHISTGPKIAPDLLRRAAKGDKEAIRELIRTADLEMTPSRLEEMSSVIAAFINSDDIELAMSRIEPSTKAAPAMEPGVFRAGAHASAGPKIDPGLIRRAAEGDEEALKQLMDAVRKNDPGMTESRLSEMLSRSDFQDAVALRSLGLVLDRSEGREGQRLADRLKAKAGVGERGRDEDRRGRKGPLGK